MNSYLDKCGMAGLGNLFGNPAAMGNGLADINAKTRTEERRKECAKECEKFCRAAEEFFVREWECEGGLDWDWMDTPLGQLEDLSESDNRSVAWYSKLIVEYWKRTYACWPIRFWKRLFGGDALEWSARIGNGR